MKSVSMRVIPSTLLALSETRPLPFTLMHTTENTVPYISLILLLIFILIATPLSTLVATLFTLSSPFITSRLSPLNPGFVVRTREF